MKLTGRTRYRTNWRGRLILQIEYSLHHTRDLNGTGYYEDWDTLHWRDARAEDLINGDAVRTALPRGGVPVLSVG